MPAAPAASMKDEPVNRFAQLPPAIVSPSSKIARCAATPIGLPSGRLLNSAPQHWLCFYPLLSYRIFGEISVNKLPIMV